MKKLVRRWLSSYKDQCRKKKFEKEVGSKYQVLVKDCEDIVVNSTGIEVFTKFHDMGGANNHGMLMHYSVENSRPIAITKIEERSLAEREYHFLMWQKAHRKNSLSAIPYGLSSVLGERYTCFITSVLTHPDIFSYSKAESLFEALGQQDNLLTHLALNGCKESLAQEIDGSTRIKSILVHLVSSFKAESAEKFLNTFLSERQYLFSNDQDLFNNLLIIMKEMYNCLKGYDTSKYEGLVHGDFKQQNILTDSTTYKVIDCQYYTYGIRLWDLAFLYSKDPSGFNEIKSRIERLDPFKDKAFIVYFYLISILINVKKKRSKKVIEMQVVPAMSYLTKLLESRKLNEL